MCLYYDIEASKDLLIDIAAGKVFFNKRYYIDKSGKIRNIHVDEEVVPDSNGFVYSNRLSTAITEKEQCEKHIYYGIHLYIINTKPRYEMRYSYGFMREIEIPVEILAEDFISCNKQKTEAVFMKIKIDMLLIQPLIEKAVAEMEIAGYNDVDDEDDDTCPDCGEIDCDGDCDEDEDDDYDDYDEDEDEDDDYDDYDEDEDEDFDDEEEE